MKKITQLFIMLFLALLFNSCKKNGTTLPPSNQATCKLKTESTTLAGNNAVYEYVYNTDGKITTIKKFTGVAIADSIINAGTFPSGQYGYSLLIDGKKVDSKNMELLK